MSVSLLWLRQDLRVTDHPALCAALSEGEVIPVYVLDDEGAGPRQFGGAQRWWLHHSLASLDQSLKKRGSRLILARGNPATVLAGIAANTGAQRVHAHHHYEAWQRRAEREVGARLDLVLHQGNYLAAPETVRNGQGERYRVFTPWYRRLLEHMPPAMPLPAPERIATPAGHPESETLVDWALLPASPDWSTGFAEWQPGEKGAWRRWRHFCGIIDTYRKERDFPAIAATSKLSPHIRFGEISPRSLWHGLLDSYGEGPSCFRSELAWREHGLNLIDQMPDYPDRNGRAVFDNFSWRAGPEADRDFRAWTRGLTGYPVVDAGMRELWMTGWMHNRVRMIVASFLVKHLLIDWRRGEQWFWDTLLDADLGANAMNWQYVAGTGVDAPVFSRIMAPGLQSGKFAMAAYVRTFVPEIAHLSDAEIDEAHLSGARVPGYPEPLISHVAARQRALGAWAHSRAG